MPITPFQIVNPDGSTNQEEYNRCMEFLQSYIAGTVQVYPELVWDNPYEINEDSVRSSLEILLDEIYGGHDTNTPAEVTNRLLTVDAFNQFKRFFRGFVKGISRTLIADPMWLANSKNFVDGPGHLYNIFDFEEPEVIWEYNHLPYVNNPERELLGPTCLYNWVATETRNILNSRPASSSNMQYYTGWNYNIPGYDRIKDAERFWTTPQLYQRVFDTYLLSLFYRTARQYQQTTGLFYLSQCNDTLFNSGYLNYYEPRLNRNMYFTLNQTIESEGGKVMSGCPLSQVETARSKIIYNNSALDINAFKTSTAPAITPLYFDCYKNALGAGSTGLTPTGRNSPGYLSVYSLFNSNYETMLVPYFDITYEETFCVCTTGAVEVCQATRNGVTRVRYDMSDVEEGNYKTITVTPSMARYHDSTVTRYTLTLRLYRTKLVDGLKIGVIDPGDNNTEHIINISGRYTATNVLGYDNTSRKVQVGLKPNYNFLVSCDDIT